MLAGAERRLPAFRGSADLRQQQLILVGGGSGTATAAIAASPAARFRSAPSQPITFTIKRNTENATMTKFSSSARNAP